jgi:hypothetical protein
MTEQYFEIDAFFIKKLFFFDVILYNALVQNIGADIKYI